MMAVQDGISIAFALLNLFLLYYILVEIYVHLIIVLAIYIGYRYIQSVVEENIDIKGKGVLITGCDTGMCILEGHITPYEHSVPFWDLGK